MSEEKKMKWFLGKISDKEGLIIRESDFPHGEANGPHFFIEMVDLSDMTYTERNMLPRFYKWPFERRKFHYNRGDYD